MSDEINFSDGARGKFYRPDAKLNLPVTAGCVLEKIKRADQRAKNEGTLTHEEAKQRLGKWLGAGGDSAEFWLGLQADYDLKMARKAAGDAIARDISPMALAA